LPLWHFGSKKQHTIEPGIYQTYGVKSICTRDFATPRTQRQPKADKITGLQDEQEKLDVLSFNKLRTG